MTQDNSKNPLIDWNFIYVFYCDGSIFVGDSEYNNGSGLVNLRGNAVFRGTI